jgi:hypothetical protein
MKRRHVLTTRRDGTIQITVTRDCYSHQQAVLEAAADKQQDVVFKITAPSSLRDAMLRHLDTYNVNAYSLFDREESLMEMLARRQLNAPHRRE